MPSDRFLKGMNGLHRSIFNASGGRILGSIAGMPVVDLITTGAKSGQKRASMLTSPVQLGDSIVLIASRGGDPTHPAWYHNIKKNPEVEVKMRGGRKKMLARVATPAERAEIWPQVTKQYKGYAGYQTKTTREIPVVILEPLA